MKFELSHKIENTDSLLEKFEGPQNIESEGLMSVKECNDFWEKIFEGIGEYPEGDDGFTEIPEDRASYHDAENRNMPLVKEEIEVSENTKNEVKSPRHITTINEDLAEQKYPGTNIEYGKHIFQLYGELVEGVFPEFFSKFEVNLPENLLKASDTEQFRYCTEKLRTAIENNPELEKRFTPRQLEQIKNGEPRISGLTWHHSEIPGKMQLVNAAEHSICRHTGGRSIWGGGAECR